MKRVMTPLFLLSLTLAAFVAVGGCGSDDPAAPVVVPDTTPAGVSDVGTENVDEIVVVFDERVDKTSAEDVANYVVEETGPAPVMKWQKQPQLAGGAATLTVASASLSADERTVTLTTQNMDLFTLYRVTVDAVTDLAGNAIDQPIERSVANNNKSQRIYTIVGTGIPGLGGENQDPLQTDLYLVQDMTMGPDGLLYVVDWNNHRIRVIENGLIRTIIGTGLLGDAPDGFGLEIGLNHPTGITFDNQGYLIMSAWHNSKLMRMDTNGYMTAICNQTGLRTYGGDDGPAIDAYINIPSNVVIDSQGRIVIADQANHCIRRIELDNTIVTIVGRGTQPGSYCGDGGPAKDACLHNPIGQNAFPGGRIVFDTNYNLYLCDTINSRVRRVDAQTDVITTVVGNGTSGFSGDGGAAVDAQIDYPADLAFGPDGSLYIADVDNHCVRRVDSNGVITTFAGTGGQAGFEGDGGVATSARLFEPFGVMVDAQGNVYIADTKNHRIRIVYN